MPRRGSRPFRLVCMSANYYDILGVPKSASEQDIKTAFRSLARKYHPDVSDAPDAQEKFQEISKAYSVLNDSEMRARYDQFGEAGVGAGAGGGGQGFEVDLSDIFDSFFGGGGMGGGGGGRSQRRAGPMRGNFVR
ncbi:unnamed protein product, partial [Discosporangium mesarthrocarpum]